MSEKIETSEVVKPSPEMMQSTIQRYFAASRSSDKAMGMAACFAVDGVSRDPVEGPGVTGPAAICQFFQGVIDLFTSIHLTEEFISINGSEAAVKWQGHGVAKNGREVNFEGIDLFEFNSEGQIQLLKAYWQPAAMLAQLQAEV